MSDVKETLKSGLTPRAFIVGLILVIAWTVYGTFAGGIQPEYGLASILADPYHAQSGILAVFIISIFSSVALKAIGFEAGEVIVIYTMLMSSQSLATIGAGSGILPIREIYARLSAPTEMSVDIVGKQPSFWLPSTEAMLPMLQGGASVPWGEWMVPLAYWALIFLSFYMFNLCFTLVLSHRIIVEERLPFPFATAVAGAMGDPKKPLRERADLKLIAVSLVIGFLFQSTYGLLQLIVPTIPQLWPVGWGGWMYFDLGPMIGPGIMNMMFLFTCSSFLAYVALWFLIPTKILFSAELAVLIWYFLLPAAEVATGLVPNVASFGLYDVFPSFITLWGTLGDVWGTTGIQIFLMILLGVPLGVIITYTILSAKTIGGSFKAALRNEKTGPFSSRLLWVGLIASLAVLIALLAINEISILSIVSAIFLWLMLSQLGNRLRGESTRYGYDCWSVTGTTSVFMATMGEVGSVEAYRTMSLGVHSFIVPNTGSWYLLEGFRLCETNNTRATWRGLVMATIAATVVSYILLNVIFIYGAYTYGFLVRWPAQYLAPHGDQLALYIYNPSLGIYTYAPAATNMGRDLWIGIAVGLIITVMSYMFPWFPIHPVGFALGGYAPWVLNFWFQTLIALIIRVLVLKIGGPNLYEKKAVPIALGLILGYALCQIVYGVAITIRVLA